MNVATSRLGSCNTKAASRHLPESRQHRPGLLNLIDHQGAMSVDLNSSPEVPLLLHPRSFESRMSGRDPTVSHILACLGWSHLLPSRRGFLFNFHFETANLGKRYAAQLRCDSPLGWPSLMLRLRSGAKRCPSSHEGAFNWPSLCGLSFCVQFFVCTARTDTDVARTGMCGKQTLRRR